uniref:Uncharacterized protein n=1 Tax=Cacopsylla melanoneura TaxID=428564 RepID=A0A8D8RHV7_9HEMI
MFKECSISTISMGLLRIWSFSKFSGRLYSFLISFTFSINPNCVLSRLGGFIWIHLLLVGSLLIFSYCINDCSSITFIMGLLLVSAYIDLMGVDFTAPVTNLKASFWTRSYFS